MTKPSQRPEIKVGQQRLETIEMVDTRNPIPPSIDGGGLNGILFGPTAGQPSSNLSNSVGFSIGGFLFLQIAIVLLTALFNTIMFVGSLVSRNTFTFHDNLIHYILFPFSGYTFGCLVSKYHKARFVTLLYFSIMAAYYSTIVAAIVFSHDLNEIYSEDKIGFFIFIILISIGSLCYMYFSKRVRLTYSHFTTSA